MPERSMKMSREKLRSYSKEFKAQIIKECVETNKGLHHNKTTHSCMQHSGKSV
jgi:transposase-like protein